jgi:hypothetical protein
MGVMKNRPYGDGELIITLLAVQKSRIQTSKRLSVATWTFGTVGPSEPFKQFTALFIGVKEFNYIRESHSENPI